MTNTCSKTITLEPGKSCNYTINCLTEGINCKKSTTGDTICFMPPPECLLETTTITVENNSISTFRASDGAILRTILNQIVYEYKGTVVYKYQPKITLETSNFFLNGRLNMYQMMIMLTQPYEEDRIQYSINKPGSSTTVRLLSFGPDFTDSTLNKKNIKVSIGDPLPSVLFDAKVHALTEINKNQFDTDTWDFSSWNNVMKFAPDLTFTNTRILKIDPNTTYFAPTLPTTISVQLGDYAFNNTKNTIDLSYFTKLEKFYLDFDSVFTQAKTLNISGDTGTYTTLDCPTFIGEAPSQKLNIVVNDSKQTPQQVFTGDLTNLKNLQDVGSLTLDSNVIEFNPTSLPENFALTLNSLPKAFCSTSPTNCSKLTSITLNTTTTTNWKDLDLSKLADLTTIILSGAETAPLTTSITINANGFTGTFDFSKVSWDSVNKITISNGASVTGLTIPECTSLDKCNLDFGKLGIPKNPAIKFILDLTKTTPANITFNNTPANTKRCWCYKASTPVVVVGINWVLCPPTPNPNIPALCETTQTDPNLIAICSALTAINSASFKTTATTVFNTTLPAAIKSNSKIAQGSDAATAAQGLIDLFQSFYTFYSVGTDWGADNKLALAPMDTIFCTVYDESQDTFDSTTKTCTTPYPLYYWINSKLSPAEMLNDHIEDINSSTAFKALLSELKSSSSTPFGTKANPVGVGTTGSGTSTKWNFQTNFNKIVDSIKGIISSYTG